jgi:hypothetical protein
MKVRRIRNQIFRHPPSFEKRRPQHRNMKRPHLPSSKLSDVSNIDH